MSTLEKNMAINIESLCLAIDQSKQTYSSFELFQCLIKRYSDEQLFLLESLNGPKKDMAQAVIGFNPICHIEFTENKLTIYAPLSMNQIILNQLKTQLAKIKLLEQSDDKLLLALPCKKCIWKALRAIESCFAIDYQGESHPIRFGLFGYMGYDSVYSVEELPYKINNNKTYPTMSFAIYQGIILLDLQKNQAYLTLNNAQKNSDFFPKIHHNNILDFIENNYVPSDNNTHNLTNTLDPCEPVSITDKVNKQQYLNWVKKALYHIGIGDIYQVQFGHEIIIKSEIEPLDVYQRLRALNPSPYMYYTVLSGQHIIGASPELFIRIEPDNKITMRPIAGTVRRDQDPKKNKLLQQQLLNDPKERAEHIMLVDLGRNDIGRVCQVHSLEVDELMRIEQYSHVSHIVSNVIGTKSKNHDKYDVLAATFPAGTMTGSPKIRAMEIIEDTETSRRGIYAGCIGFIGFNGIVETALCIRTAVYNQATQEYVIRASGGVVYDSTPEGEWSETISKLSATYFAITNKELRDESIAH